MRYGRKVARLGLAALAMASLVSCGSDPRFADGDIRGVVWLSGPVAGARVCVYQADESGGRGAAPLGECVDTAADGSFAAGVGVGMDTLLIEVSGPATYVELATGESLTLDPRVVLQAAVTRFVPDETRESVVVSPLGSLAVSLAGARLALGKEATYTAAVERAQSLIGAHFGDVKAGGTVPADPTLEPASSLTEDVRYGLVLAGLSHLAYSIRQQSSLTVNGANTALLTERLASDLASAEALFDGQGASGPLSLGLCQCTGEPCDTLCTFDSRTPRGDLAGETGIVGFLGGSRNATGLGYDDVATLLVERIALDTEPELFPPGDPGPVDTTAPTVAFVSPDDATVVDGLVAIEVTATDATRVASLVVTVGGAPAPADTDPAAIDHYAGQLDTAGLPDGPLTLSATAVDPAGNQATVSITVTINNLGPGTLGGTCVKGPLADAAVRAYRFAGGEPGDAIGVDAVTDAAGHFTITGIEAYAGPLLVECGGSSAHYEEEAFLASITLSTDDHLRTVVAGYMDGENRNGVMLTPWTSIATAYLEWSIAGATPLPAAELDARYQAAFGLISDHLDVADVATLEPTPLTPAVTTYTDGSRYALTLAALSQLAVRFADDNGAVLPGPTVNAASVWRALERDVTDGCLDGRDAAGVITVVGIPLTSDTARYELAEAIVAYLTGDLNPTSLTSPPDAIDFLDHLSAAGPSDPLDDPSVCGTGALFPDAGDLYDRVPPEVVWDTPAHGDHVRDTIEVRAHAQDAITAAPALALTEPPGLVNLDPPGTGTVRALIDTHAYADGNLTIVAETQDGAGNPGGGSLSLTVDNTDPLVSIDAVAEGSWTGASVPVTVTVTDDNPDSLAVTLDGVAVAATFTVATSGVHAVAATATDRAGNSGSAGRGFIVDRDPPIITITAGPANLSHQGGTFTFTAEIADGSLATAGSLPDVPETLWATVAGTGVVTQTRTPLVGGGFRLAVEIATTAADDGPLTVSFGGQDRAGNPAVTVSRTITVDNTWPQVVIDTVAEGTWTHADVPVSVTVTETNLATLEVTLDGIPVGPSFTVTSTGIHEVVATATDLAGHGATATRSFVVDKDPPTITIQAGPAALSAVRGTFAFTASIGDGALQAAGSLPDQPVTLSASVVATGAVSLTQTRTPLGGGGLQLVASIGTSAASDGALTVTFTGQDRAGNPAVAVSRTVTVDNTAPSAVTVTDVTYGTLATSGVLVGGKWYTPQNPVTLHGAVVDTFASPTWVKLWVGATSHGPYPVDPVSGAWHSGAITLPVTNAEQGVALEVWDAAGNTLDPDPSVTIYVDTAPPAVNVETFSMVDEARIPITFDAASRPCYGGVTTDPLGGCPVGSTKNWGTASLSMCDTSLGCTPPTVRKYSTRMAGTTADDNPLEWHLTVGDGGSTLDTVRYRVHYPAGADAGLRPAGDTGWVDATAMPPLSDYSHRIVVASSVAGLDVLGDPLKQRRGTFWVEVVARDRAGNPSSKQLLWTHEPLGAPVSITVTALGESDPRAAIRYTLTANSLAKLINGSFAPGEAAGLLKVTIKNGTDEPVNLGFVLPPPSAWASDPTVQARWVERNASLGAYTPTYACPGDEDTGGFYSQFSVSGTTKTCGYVAVSPTEACVVGTLPSCSASLHPTAAPVVLGEPLADVILMEGVDSTCAGCASALAAPDPLAGQPVWEWTIEPRSSVTNQAREATVIVAAQDFSFLKWNAGATYQEFTVGTAQLTGKAYEQWVKCTASTVLPDGSRLCTAQTKYQRYQALKSVQVTANSLGVFVRSRPHVDARLDMLYGGSATGATPRYPDLLTAGGTTLMTNFAYGPASETTLP